MPASARAAPGGDERLLPGPTRRRCGRTGACRRRRWRRARWCSWRATSPGAGRKAKVTSVVPSSRVGERLDDELHGLADLELVGVGGGQPRLDEDLAGEVDVADAVGLERLAARCTAPWARTAARSSSTACRCGSSRCSSTFVDVQRAHDAGRGNDTAPQARHAPPMSRGSSDGQVNRPSAIGAVLVASASIGSLPSPNQPRPVRAVNSSS